MNHPFLARTIGTAAIACLVATGFASAASADEANAILTVGTLETLTLPAADGVRDQTQLTISSDIATTVSLVIRNAANFDVVTTLPDVTLEAETPATVDVVVTDLPAGNLEVYATPTAGESIIRALTVGSGEPENVSLSLDTPVIYTYTGATPRVSVATVSATDETGLAVPFTGTVTATVGGKTSAPAVTSTTGEPATANIGVSKLGVGTGTVVASVHGPSETSYPSEPVTLSVKQLAISSIAVATSSTSVFPYKDNYYDTVKITVTPKTTAPITFGATGSVKITRNGTTVKSWTLTSSKAWTGTWDGKVGGKIVPGTYTIVATLKGKEGASKTYSKSITVKPHRLVTKTQTLTYKATSVFKQFASFDSDSNNACWLEEPRAGHVFCDGTAPAADPEDYAALSFGTITVPSAVLAAEKFGGTKATVTLYDVKRFTGAYGDWYLETDNGTWRSGVLASGTKALGSITLNTNSKKVYVTLGLLDGSQISVGSAKVTYTYKVLVS